MCCSVCQQLFCCPLSDHVMSCGQLDYVTIWVLFCQPIFSKNFTFLCVLSQSEFYCFNSSFQKRYISTVFYFNIASIASFTDLTPVRRIPFGTDPLSFMESRLTWGRMHSSNQSFFASVTRCSAILTARTSPLKPTSPKQIVFSLIGFSR